MDDMLGGNEIMSILAQGWNQHVRREGADVRIQVPALKHVVLKTNDQGNVLPGQFDTFLGITTNFRDL